MNTNTDAAFLGQRSYKIPETMKAWVLGDPEQLTFVDKPVPQPGAAEVLVRIDAIAVCATDLEHIEDESYDGVLLLGPMYHLHDLHLTDHLDLGQLYQQGHCKRHCLHQLHLHNTYQGTEAQ